MSLLRTSAKHIVDLPAVCSIVRVEPEWGCKVAAVGGGGGGRGLRNCTAGSRQTWHVADEEGAVTAQLQASQ